MADALMIGWTRAEADARRKTYRTVLAINLVVYALVAIAAVLGPRWLSHLLHLPDPYPTAWVRMWGAMLLVMVLLYLPGYLDPVYARWPNAVGILARFGLGILYICFGFLWCALVELVFAVLLAWTYMNLFHAELGTRP